MLIQMSRRGAKQKQICDIANKLQVKVILRKAFPANATDIFNLIEYTSKKYDINNNFYKSEYDVLEDIKNG